MIVGAWDIRLLEERLSGKGLKAANSLVRQTISQAPGAGDAGAAADVCIRWRRWDLAADIHAAAFKSGADPYHGPYSAEATWHFTSDEERTAAICSDFISLLPELSFQANGDDFHKRMIVQALDNICQLARFEAGAAPPEGIVSSNIHGIAQAALWKRIWRAHTSLQFAKARKLARIYIAIAKPNANLIFSIVETFFADRDGAPDGIALLEQLSLDEADAALRAAVICQLAYENGIRDRLRHSLDYLDGLPSAPTGATANRNRATGLLYEAQLALDSGKRRRASTIAKAAATQFKDEQWVDAFGWIRGSCAKSSTPTQAAIDYNKALFLPEQPRSPAMTQAIADLLAAAGRWTDVHRIFEHLASNVREAYRPIIRRAYSTSDPDSFPSSALLLSGWGVGDDIFRLGLLRAHYRSGKYTVMLDHRLVAMARRANPDWRFLSHSRVCEVGEKEFWRDRLGVPDAVDAFRVTKEAFDEAAEHGAVAVLEDLQAIHAYRRGKARYPNSIPLLAPDASRVRHFVSWLRTESSGLPAVGLSWRSGLLTTSRARSFFNNREVGALMAGANVRWVMMQYGWTENERRDIESQSGTRFLVPPDLDLREDLEGLAALALACDLVVSTGVATREVCAAAGANTLSISFGWSHADAWRRSSSGQDSIFPSLTHIDSSKGRAEVLRLTRSRIAKLMRLR
jgi:hypothetical protein